MKVSLPSEQGGVSKPSANRLTEPMPDRGERRLLEQFKIRTKADYDNDVYRLPTDANFQPNSYGQQGPQRSFMDEDYGQYREISLDQTSGIGF